MSNTLNLTLKGSSLAFDVRRILVAGYTGRDEAQVRAHISELEREGIPAPDSVPALYPLDAAWASVERRVAASARVSGEAEPALLFRSNSLADALVAVIVDFTDREEERRSIPRSKVQTKPLSAIVWEYSDVQGAWDDIALRSWVGLETKPELYQSGRLAQLLRPEDLLARLTIQGELSGAVLLMGTLPLLSGRFSFTDYFACELEAPDGSKLAYSCRINRAVH